MRYARVFLAFALAVAWLGLAAPPRAAYDSAAQAVEPGRAPASLTPPEWQGIQAQLAKLTAADGVPGDGFGVSVSMDGDTAVVGAIWVDVGGNIDQGAAYVFYRNQGGPNAWGQVAKLTAADGAAQDYFGQSVSISDDTAVVGALNASVGGNLMQGAAYVFSRDHGGANAWGQVAKLTAADGAANDRFGISVSASGDTALVGAYWANVGGHIEQGAAYVYYRNQGGADAWGQVAKLTAAGGAGGDRFGLSVSVSGDRAVGGAGCGACAAYVFYRNQSGADAWGQVAKLTADDAPGGDFGAAVSVSGDTAVVGAFFWADGQGAAYVFDRDQGGTDAWGQVAKLTAADGLQGDQFGYSVSVSGDTAVIGASLADVGGNWYQGAAYAFYRSLGGADAWGQAAKLTAADGAGGDWFGDSVSVSGDTALVGAYAASGPRPVQGAAYVHALPPGAADDEYSTPEDTLLSATAGPGVLANDADPDGASLTAVLDTGPAHGTLDLRPDGSFTYSPAANWNGVDALTYHANNGMYNSDPATVTIAVTPVNDAPIAVNDVYGTRRNLPLVLTKPGVLLNDTDIESDPLTAVLDTTPSHGALDLKADGSFTYTPTTNWDGADTFSYHATDGAAGSNMATVKIIVFGHVVYLPLVLRAD